MLEMCGWGCDDGEMMSWEVMSVFVVNVVVVVVVLMSVYGDVVCVAMMLGEVIG